MQTNVRQLKGNWDLGFALDKHVRQSTYLGDDEYGHAQFDTTRSEVGEALFRLKYRDDRSKVDLLAAEMIAHIYPRLGQVDLLIPMIASNWRPRQPVAAIAEAIGRFLGLPVFDTILSRTHTGKQLKNLDSKEEKAAALAGSFTIADGITNDGRWNALLIDDLYASGASLEAACAALRHYSKIAKIYVATLTWK